MVKLVKEFYWSNEGSSYDEAENYKKINPEKLKAKILAKKIGGTMRTKYVPSDDGYIYSVYK